MALKKTYFWRIRLGEGIGFNGVGFFQLLKNQSNNNRCDQSRNNKDQPFPPKKG